MVFGFVPTVKTEIGVPVKVVYLHYTAVYCACLSVLLGAFLFLLQLSLVATLLGELVIWSSSVLSENVL